MDVKDSISVTLKTIDRKRNEKISQQRIIFHINQL